MPFSPRTKAAALNYARSFVVAIAVSAVIAVTIDYICFLFIGETSIGTWYNKYWIGFFFCCAFLASCFVVLRKQLANKPEYLYLIIVLTVSLFMAWSLSVVIVGWDTGIHFRNVLGWADIDDQFELSTSELSFITTSLPLDNSSENPYSLESLYKLQNWVNENNENIADVRTAYSFWNVATAISSIPPAIIMFFCEQANLPFTVSHFLSLTPCIFIYAFVTFFGMKKLKSGKMLYSIICLLPTAVFQVSNYGYQYWNQAFFLYGFACLAGFIQRKEVVPFREIVMMLMALLIACLPRMSYGLLILLSLLVPKQCFKTSKYCIAYRICIISLTLLAGIYALAPLFADGLGEGDPRGGDDINPGAQISYILNSPIEYLQRMLSFLAPPYMVDDQGVDVASGFLTPSGSIRFIGLYGYLGYIPYPLFLFVLVLLVFTALTDKKANLNVGLFPGLACILVSFITIMLTTTYMYITYNNVGEDAFRGMQSRYLLPLVYPTLAFVGPNKWGLSGSLIPTQIYNLVALAIMAFTLLAGWWFVYLINVY